MNIDEREAKLGTGKRFAKLERKLSHQKGIRDPGAVAAAHGRETLGKERFQKLAAAGRRRHHESAEQIVNRLLEYGAHFYGHGNTGSYDPEVLRNTIRDLMQKRGIGYEEARDIAMAQHDPKNLGATPATATPSAANLPPL